MRRSSVVVALLGVVAVHAILFWISWVPEPRLLWGDERMYWDFAVERAGGADAPIEMLWPPLYPHALSWWVRLTGARLLPLQMLQTLMLIGGALLLRDVWRRLIGTGPTADVFALTLMAWPAFAAYGTFVWPESVHFLLFSFALWILTARRDRLPWLAGLGAVLGLALLTKSVLSPFLPVLLLPVVRRVAPRIAVVRVGVVLGVLCLTIAPTLAEHHRREGVWAIAASGRFNLWVGLNDVSRRPFVDEIVGREYQTWRRSATRTDERNTILDGKIRERIASEGLPSLALRQLGVQYFRLFDKDSFLTLQLPGGTLHRRGRGYRDPPELLVALLRGINHVGWAALLVLASFGIFLCPPRGRGFMWIVLAFLIYNLALFLAVHVKARYRFPLIPFLVGYAIVGVAGWNAWRRGRTGPLPFEPTALRLSAAAIASVTSLYFAFGGAWLDG